jgi:transaldolase
LYGRGGQGRFSIYVPDELAEDVERAIQNGRELQKLMTEAGRRYTLALKNERRARSGK